MSAAGGRRRRRGGRVALATGAVIAAGAAAVASTGVGWSDVFGASSSSSSGSSGLPPATAKITRQDLVDTVTRTGDLGFGTAVKLSSRLSGTVTSMPATGATVTRGKAVYKVDNKPVVLLYGRLPAYRALATGDTGADVKQFEQNLHALGYGDFTVDSDYTSATASAVRRWQGDLGLSKTGTVDLGRVFYAPGPVRVDAYKAALGDPIGAGGPVLNYTGTTQSVSVELPFDYRQLAKTGAAVTVKLPDGKTVPGKIAKATTVVKAATSAQTSDTTVIDVDVTVNDPKTLAGLDQATLDVAFASSQRKDVLTVPVAALLALSEGGYGVQLVENGSTKLVAVTTGLFAGGEVEISGSGITEGATVGMPG